VEEFWGDQLAHREGCIRIVYNNCDGLQIKEYLRAMATQRREIKKEQMLSSATEVTKVGRCVGLLRAWNANIVCLAETQTAWEIPTVQRSLLKEIRRQDQYGGYVGSSSSLASASVVKPGGSAMIWDGNWGRKIMEKGEDPYKLGRWTYIKLKGRNNYKLSIFTVYRCCKVNNRKKTGLTSSYAQQITLLKKMGIKKQPQDIILEHLKESIKAHQKDGCEILLCMDANEQWEEKRSKIEDFALSLGLEDIARTRHQGQSPPTYTRINTNRKIDFLLGTEKVINNVMAYGMAPLSTARLIGDHRAQYVDLNIKTLLNMNTYDCTTPSSRRLKSPDPKCVKKYVKKLTKSLTRHKVMKRLGDLLKEVEGTIVMTASQIKIYESLDADIFRLCRSAENAIKLHKQKHFAWSPILDKAFKISQYWKLREDHLSNIEKTNKIIKLASALGIRDNNDRKKSHR